MKHLLLMLVCTWTAIAGPLAGVAMAERATLLDFGQTSADQVFRALYLKTHGIDLYGKARPAGEKPRYVTQVCSLESLPQGMRERSCVPMALAKACGESCLEFSIDSQVLTAHRAIVEETIAAPCKALAQVRTPQGLRDTHPTAFFLSYQRSRWILRCDSSDPVTASTAIKGGTLRVEYRVD